MPTVGHFRVIRMIIIINTQVELFSALIKQTSRHSAARHGVQSFLANATNLFR